MKKAGNKFFDAKTSHITIAGENMTRQTFTTCFDPNISHTGEHSAFSIDTKFKMLSVLTNQKSEDLKADIDFWMGDRADDVTKAMEILGIESKKVLRCSAHITCGADNAVDKVFKHFESTIGVQNLISLSEIQSAFLKSNSVFIMAINAISKLLSYSHATLPYSLCVVYKNWRKTQGLDTNQFKGFSSNRFGRTVTLAKMFLEHRDDLVKFFDQCVDENANKLVLAVSGYITSDWMFMCSKAYCMIGDMFILPLCDILGIDESRTSKRTDRTWPGVKDFLEEKLKVMEKFVKEAKDGLAVEKLAVAATKEVMVCVRRQMEEVEFLKVESSVDEETVQKMLYSPLTNSGCESRQSNLDRRVKFSGGSTPLQTISNKEVVSGNKYLITSEFSEASVSEQSRQFKWARNSTEAKEAWALQENLINLAAAVDKEAFKAKEAKKKKKVARSLTLLDQCKNHGGPVSPISIDILDSLTEKQLLTETRYLRSTVAPHIKERHAIIDKDGKRKMPILPLRSLKENIKAVINPEASPVENIEALIEQAFLDA